MRKPRGFRAWNVPVGILFVREEDDGGWVVLAGEPDVKIDNKHLDGTPHMHIGDWDSKKRQTLRKDLTATEAAATIARQLSENGFLDPDGLKEELG